MANSGVSGGSALSSGLSATPIMTMQPTAILAGAGMVNTTPFLALTANAILAGSSTLIATPFLALPVNALLAGTSSFSAVSFLAHQASALLSASSTLASAPFGGLRANAVLAGGSSLIATSNIALQVSAVLAGGSSLIATSSMALQASAVLVGGGLLFAMPALIEAPESQAGEAFQCGAFQENAFQTCDHQRAAVVEVYWPNTRLKPRRGESDYPLIRQLVRSRDRAIAEYQRRNKTEEEPEVRVEIPRGISPEVERALREFLAPYNITPFTPPLGLVTELALIEAQRLEDELRLLEEEELAIVLALAA